MLRRLDIHEDKEKNVVTATFELPGINKQDVSIDVQNGRLTVSGESRFENEDRKENGYVLRERRFGRFSRSLLVPQGIKVSSPRCASLGEMDQWTDLEFLCSPRISRRRWRTVS